MLAADVGSDALGRAGAVEGAAEEAVDELLARAEVLGGQGAQVALDAAGLALRSVVDDARTEILVLEVAVLVLDDVGVHDPPKVQTADVAVQGLARIAYFSHFVNQYA